MNAYRQKIKKDFLQFSGIDRAAISREAHKKAGGYAFFCYFTGCPGKNLLTTMTGSEQADFAGAFCTKAVLTDLFFKLTCKIVAKSSPGKCIFIIFDGKSGISV